MNLIEESYTRLFPNKEFPYLSAIEYNRRLADFNATIALRRNMLTLKMNLQWKDIDDEIKIGLAQHLLLKILKIKHHTPNIELYNSFIRQIPILTPKTKSDPLLEQAFGRVNEQFFQMAMEKPNLQWGVDAKRRLASYNFHNDTITVSTLFQDSPTPILDYLLYHELLHKHFTFSSRNGRSRFHTKEFRNAESLFPEQERIVREINSIIRSKTKRKSWTSYLPF